MRMEGTCETARRHSRVARVEEPVDVLSSAVGVRAGVVAAEDEVRLVGVLVDVAVPDGLARAAHAHGEREHAEGRTLLRARVQNGRDSRAGGGRRRPDWPCPTRGG